MATYHAEGCPPWCTQREESRPREPPRCHRRPEGDYSAVNWPVPWLNSGMSYGTKIQVASAPVSFTASDTFLNTGRSRWVLPAFFGFVPPTTFVPIGIVTKKRRCELQSHVRNVYGIHGIHGLGGESVPYSIACFAWKLRNMWHPKVSFSLGAAALLPVELSSKIYHSHLGCVRLIHFPLLPLQRIREGMQTRRQPSRLQWIGPSITYVPCLPVKPWKITLVLELMRRLSTVAA